MPDNSDFPIHEALARNTGFLISRLGWFAQRRFSERIAAVGLTPRGWGGSRVLARYGPSLSISHPPAPRR